MARFGDALVEATEAAQRWAMHDPDPRTRGQIDALVDAGDPALIRLFGDRLTFGTAGLRAPVGLGPTRMNALVVRQTTVAVVNWLAQQGNDEPVVVIGFDARHDSRRFAAHAAAAVIAQGGKPLLSADFAPTPVFAHALLGEQADAAVVITASHNPPADNGYKLYLGDGLQLVSPADEEIAATIYGVASGWNAYGIAIDDAFAELDELDRVDTDRWLAGHRDAAVAALHTGHRDIAVVYTPMHGVGGEPVVAAFDQAGFTAPRLVAEQMRPDPTFPTVGFPNPEEAGALDIAFAAAILHGVDAVLANDPDADRLAVAVPGRDGDGFVALSGNELGIVFADHVLRSTAGPKRVISRSVVSTRQVDAMAAASGVHCEVTLTGFKWVARPILDPTVNFVFGFEEAIGYCIGDRVRDKDGISAALVAAEILAELRANGLTVWDRLDQLAQVHGIYASQSVVVRFDDDPDQVATMVDRVSQGPPAMLGESAVVTSGAVGLGALPTTPGVHLLAEDQTQVIIRPSGTEPKVKAYIEVIEPVANNAADSADADAVANARSRANRRLSAVTAQISSLLS